MSRYAGFGLVLIVALMIAGCSDPEPEAAQPTPPTQSETPAVDSPAQPMPLTQSETPTVDSPAKQTPSASASVATMDELPDAETSLADTPAEEAKPTVLGAIGRAVVGALGTSGKDEPSEAPAYQPR